MAKALKQATKAAVLAATTTGLVVKGKSPAAVTKAADKPKQKHTERPATEGGAVLFDVSADKKAGHCPQGVLRRSGSMAKMALELVRAYPKYVSIADLQKHYPDVAVDNRLAKFSQWPSTFTAEFSENGHQVRVKLLNPKALVGASLKQGKERTA